MKTMLRTLIAVLAMGLTTAAFAAPDRDHYRDHHGYYGNHDHRGGRYDGRWHGHRPPPPRYYGHGYHPGRGYYRGRGYHHRPAYYHRPPPHRYYGR